ncbi:MAG: NAD+ synthase [Candidatus Omnitrophica bacterium]|nr:NAD+ synthase [Candidatus Omnitrophota bacterium]
MRIAMAQMNPTVGDYEANTQKIIAWIEQAEKQEAEIIVFPEMALHGYPVWDLANKKNFVAEGIRCLKRITAVTRHKRVHVLLGFIEPAKKGDKTGKNHNSLAWIQGGKIRGVQHKTLLPTYDVFLEGIFFKPAKSYQLFTCGKLKIGPTICEDIWDDGYEVKPVRELVKRGAQWIVNVSASPYYRGVSTSREALLKRHALQNRRPILYVNQVGGQDDLVFDGRSLFVDAKGQVLFRAPAFEEGLFFYDWNRTTQVTGSKKRSAHAVVTGTPAEMYQALVLGVRDYCRKNKFSRVLIGLSGGIDSALVAAIAADALGPDAVTGVTMPSGFSSPGSWQDSQELARNLGIECRKHSIKDKFEFLVGQYWQHYVQEGREIPKQGKITLSMENLQARIRGLELMFLSNHEGRLLLSTGNKSELAMGYCTLYGDMAGGLCVLGDVYKTDVYRLACYRNTLKVVIPEKTIAKAPSAELRPNQKDQDSLPPYDVLDEVLDLYIEQNKGRDEILHHFRAKKGKKVPGSRSAGCLAPSQQEISEILRKVDHNEYKRRQTPPIIRVTHKAWFGRRMPITNRFES